VTTGARKRLWFIVPAHRRFAVTEACLRQLARTCEALSERGLDAAAIVVADDRNLAVAEELGFGTVRQRNAPLGRKLNDGIEFAAMSGVDYVVYLGSDDWVDAALFLDLPDQGTVRCSRLSAVVREDGRRLAPLKVRYFGGDGVRITPVPLLEAVRFRPAEEDRARAMDASTFTKLRRALGRPPDVRYLDLHPLQIVDFKSERGQLNDYRGCVSAYANGPETDDPWGELGRIYPAAAVDEIRAAYATGGSGRP
jgi:hypothetical protein